jgi:hemerythrin-like domain-containing protein
MRADYEPSRKRALIPVKAGDRRRVPARRHRNRRRRLEAGLASVDAHQAPAACGRGHWRMQHATLTVIRDEHAALTAMLRTLTLLLAEHRRRGTLPDFEVLRAMLFYVDEFPERLHHAKESTLLFPRLRRRSDEANAVLDRLDREHAHGEAKIRELEHALLAFEMMGEPRRAAFESAADSYVQFYLAHMRTEEREILPLAERVLLAEDWVELDEAFARNRDPLTGHEPAPEYAALFSRIVCRVPAPLGLG